MEIFSIILLLILGVLGGTVAGFLGVGGGIIFVPIYVELFSKYDIADERIAVVIIANSACLTFFSAVSGSLKQYRNRNFHFSPVLRISSVGILSSIFFSFLIASSNWYDKRIFSIVFSCLLLLVVLKALKKKKKTIESSLMPKIHAVKSGGIGLAAGAVAAFSGLGGGIVMVPLLASWAGLSLKKATSVSLGAIMLLSLSIIIYYMFFYMASVPLPWSKGAISLYYLSFLVPGVIIGAPLGVQFAKKASEKVITAIFLLFVLMVLAKTLFFVA